jgi:outer membrane protein TolC
VRLDTSLAMNNDSGITGADQSTAGQASLALNQPLLQGAGNDVAFETLTQAERDLLYDARDFELFRQDFVIGIIRDYYQLLSQKRQLANTRTNIQRQQFAHDQAVALFDIGRGDKLSVFRAEQSLFAAQNQLLSDEQEYRVALDGFKITLGLPTEVEFDVEGEFPPIRELTIELREVIEAALHNRLDLATERERVEDQVRRVMVARDTLLPRFDLTATYTKNTDAETSLAGLDFHEQIAALGLALEIPFDRKPQRNAYKAAIIGLEQARRELDRSEDQAVLDVRSSVGALAQRRQQVQIGEKEIRSLELSAEKAQLEVEQGSATNRDLTEALDDLTSAQNQQLDRIVDHEIARLTLLRQVGLLFVAEDGSVEP